MSDVDTNIRQSIAELLSITKVYQGLIPLSESFNMELVTKITKLLNNPLVSNQQVILVFGDTVLGALIDSRDGVVSDNELRKLQNSSLTDFIPDITQLVEKLFNILKSLPVTYRILFPIPKLLTDKEISLRSDLKLCKIKASEVSGPKKSALRAAANLIRDERELQAGDSVLEILTQGYAGVHGQTAMAGDSPVYLWRSIAGIFTAFNMVVQDNYVGGNMVPSYSARIYDSGGKFYQAINTDVDDEVFVRDYRFTTLSMLEGVESINWIKSFFSKTFPGSNKYEQEKRQILNSAYWLYEMRKSRSPYTRLFNGAIALDALIPVRQKSTNDKFIPWRNLFLAEAIAKSIQESDKIATDMDAFLKMRNEIIHGKDLRIIDEPGNLSLLYSAREYIESYLRKRILSFVT